MWRGPGKEFSSGLYADDLVDFCIKREDVVVNKNNEFVTILKGGIIMQRLRIQEGDKFLKFWELVQSTAQRQNKKFFMDTGEEREFFREDMEGEDLRGWLISLDKANEFEKHWLNHETLDEWEDNICWAEWEENNGKMTVSFNFY